MNEATPSQPHFAAGAPLNTKWGAAVTGGRNGYQLLPDVLVRHQVKLGLSCTDMCVLLNICMHWWENDPTNMPHPRPDQIARRLGTNSRTVQRSIAKMVRLDLIERMPVERTAKGLLVRKFNLNGLLQQLKQIAVEQAQV